MSPFLKAVSLAEALDTALAHTHPLRETERIAVAGAAGRVLAGEVTSPEDLPGFDRSGMDGYAVRARDTFGATEGAPAELALRDRVEMGHDVSGDQPLAPGQARGISTGGMLPPGADAVVILEETELEGETLRVLKPAAPGASVVRADADLKRGQLILARGHRLRPQDLGALLGVGVTRVSAFAQLQVGIISTGDELIAPEERPRPGQVRDINSTTLAAQLRALGVNPVPYGITRDRQATLTDAVSHALSECDAVLLSGGSSVGVRDAALEVLERFGRVYVHGIRVKPGKPTIFALCGDKPAFGLPGNPVSSMVVVEKFVAPILLKRAGCARWTRPRPLCSAMLSKNAPSARGRDDFVRVRLSERSGTTWAEPIFAHSNSISSLSGAHGLVPIPADHEGFERGAEVTVELW